MPDAALGKIIHKGRAYYSVGAVARLLSTSANKVREMMGRGELEWTQVRLNGRILVPAESIVTFKRRLDG